MPREQAELDIFCPGQPPGRQLLAHRDVPLISVSQPAQVSSSRPVEGGDVAYTLEFGPRTLSALERIAAAIDEVTAEMHRVANHVAPEPGDIVGTPYLAQQLGCSVVWAGEMARNGQIPKHCIVPGSGHGKPWKFYRRQLGDWLNKR